MHLAGTTPPLALAEALRAAYDKLKAAHEASQKPTGRAKRSKAPA